MSKILIIGGTGMLGHKLVQMLGKEFRVWTTIRGAYEGIEHFGIFDKDKTVESVNVENFAALRNAIRAVKPDVVINAVGIIKQVPASNEINMLSIINSILPQKLAEMSSELGFRLICISTDCVFSGITGNYSEEDVADAVDDYGRSKLLGEVKEENCLTIRTSIIGRELSSSHSLVEWFISNRGKQVKGFTKAIYSGFPTIVFVDIIADLIANHPELHGLYHISSDPVSKFDLLRLINEQFDLQIEVEPSDELVIDRSLNSDKFRAASGFAPSPWPEMIAKMHDDTTPYDKWRQ